jgi:hypothetical protein
MLWATAARAEDGGNEICPATALDADDVRDGYDGEGRLVHQLRLAQGRVVQEIAVRYQGDHAVARTELTPRGRRIARTYFDGDRIAVAECYADERRVAYARYAYDGAGRLVQVDRWVLAEASDGGAVAAPWARETTRYTYDVEGQLVGSEVRDGTGRLKRRTSSRREPGRVPIVLSLVSGGAYQSDTELFDFVGGFGIHREPKAERYATDPLEVGLDAAYRFHRVAGATSTDQTTVRLGVDYHDVVPRITLFSFVATDRNVPANLRLNLELAVLGVKVDVVRAAPWQFDVSFAPVWNFRSIVDPGEGAGDLDVTTSKLRGSFRARAGLKFETWSLVDTLELLPTIFGDESRPADDFWHRTLLRNTTSLEVSLSPRFSLRQTFKYTWDPAMRAQAVCPDADQPLCRGYAFSSTTALSVNLEL